MRGLGITSDRWVKNSYVESGDTTTTDYDSDYHGTLDHRIYKIIGSCGNPTLRKIDNGQRISQDYDNYDRVIGKEVGQLLLR